MARPGEQAGDLRQLWNNYMTVCHVDTKSLPQVGDGRRYAVPRDADGRHEGVQAQVVPLRRRLRGGAVHGGYF